MEKLWVPSDENSWRTFAFNDSVAVTIAIKAMMPMPMMPTVNVVRNAWPRMDRRATNTMSRHNVFGDAMAQRYLSLDAVLSRRGGVQVRRWNSFS